MNANEIDGTPKDLYRLREARRATASAVASMKRAGLDTEALQASLDNLEETVVFIGVPCLICKRTFPMPANVADDSLPYAVICEPCDAKTTAEVRAMNEGTRRKRRTKAEMAAARAAKAQETP